MKKLCIFFATAILGGLFLVGCQPSAGRKFRVYDNGAAYTAGDFTCKSEEVTRIEIDWLGGSVEVGQTPSDRVFVAEEENELPDEKRVHTYLSEGVLRVKYCRSGCWGEIDETQKNLQVTIPKGIDVEINSVSANVFLGVLEAGELSVETNVGNVEAESVVCYSADIETLHGYIGIGSLTAKEIELENVFGEVHLGLPVCQHTEIETKKGNVTLYLWGDVCASIGFETQKGILQTERKYEQKDGRYLFRTRGNQSVAQALPTPILIRTVSGNLYVR